MKYLRIFIEKIYYATSSAMSKQIDGDIPPPWVPLTTVFMFLSCNMASILLVLHLVLPFPSWVMYFYLPVVIYIEYHFVLRGGMHKKILKKYADRDKQVMRFMYIYMVMSILAFYLVGKLHDE